MRERLSTGGVEPWLAERLLILLPMAYTRRLLPNVTYPDVLVTPGGEVRLSTEPVFAAALARAQLAGRGEIERIALRSSEFDAINNALNAGAPLSDIRLSETRLVQDLPPRTPGDGGVPSPRAVFEELLQRHHVVLDGETKIDAELFVHPAPAGAVMAQLDFSVAHPWLAVPWLVESFAWHGASWREAIGGAAEMFERGALPVFVNALLRPGAEVGPVERERYQHPSGAFDLVLGAQLNLLTDQPVPPAGPLLDGLLMALSAVDISLKIHGLRVFLAYRDGRLQTNEVLLDGEPWPAGEAVAAGSQAPLAAGMVAVRIFGLFVPAEND